MNWQLADVYETVADTVPQRCAVVFGEQRLSWAEFDRCADGVARTLHQGGTAVLLPERSFDPAEIWHTVDRERVTLIGIVGDAFARPLLDALNAGPGRWDLSSLTVLKSAGTVWSEPIKRGLLSHLPRARLEDTLGSTEAARIATNITTAGSPGATAAFTLNPLARVLADDLTDVTPGSGRIGTPDDRFGEAVTAMVALSTPAHQDLIDHVKSRLAGYKAPRHIRPVDQVPRSPSGKPDYAAARRSVGADD